MMYHNISYREAIRILEGKENETSRTYDRYEEPTKWPILPTRTRNLSDKEQDNRMNKERELERERNMTGVLSEVISRDTAHDDRLCGLPNQRLSMRKASPRRDNNNNNDTIKKNY